MKIWQGTDGMDLVTVIVPVYNAEKTLNNTLQSLIRQTWDNIEILLIDDESSDSSGRICDNWSEADDRVRVIHKMHEGVSAARNLGLKEANGEYIVMVDSDDIVSKNMISKLYRSLELTNADMAICDFKQGQERDYQFPRTNKSENIESVNGVDVLHRIYQGPHSALRYVAPWGKLYKRKLFNDLFFPDGKIFEDIYLTHQLIFRCNRIVILGDELYYYYEHQDSIMHQKYNVKKLDYLEALKQRIIFFQTHNLKDLEKKAYDEYLHSLIWEYSRAHDLLADKKIMKNIKKRFREIYVNGSSSDRYPLETRTFLTVFSINPEWIIWYWRISAKMRIRSSNKN